MGNVFPQSSKTIHADLWVLGHCNDNKAWALAEKCEQCEFFQRRSIIQKKGGANYYIVLGSMASRILLVWMVEAVAVPKTNHKVFFCGIR